MHFGSALIKVHLRGTHALNGRVFFDISSVHSPSVGTRPPSEPTPCRRRQAQKNPQADRQAKVLGSRQRPGDSVITNTPVALCRQIIAPIKQPLQVGELLACNARTAEHFGERRSSRSSVVSSSSSSRNKITVHDCG
jgi:hypothetical protein